MQDTATLHTANPKLTLHYFQSEREPLQDFQFYLYDYDKSLAASSSHKYDPADMSHTFYGLKNESEYYIRATGTTVHGFSVDTGYIKINIQYFVMPANVLFEAKNHPENGSITLESGVIDIGYEIDNDNYSIKNSELIIGSDNTLTYNAGFKITDEFKVFVKARKLPLNSAFSKCAVRKQEIILISMLKTGKSLLWSPACSLWENPWSLSCFRRTSSILSCRYPGLPARRYGK